VPTVGILGQTSRWFTYPAPPSVNLVVTLFENYFSAVGQSIVIQSDPLSIITIPIVVNSLAGSYQPISIGRTLSVFGVTTSNPSEIDGVPVGTQVFSRPVPPPQRNTLSTPGGWGDLGQQAMVGELLVAPGNGGLSGEIYYIVAGGDVSVPATNSTALWSVVCQLTGNGRNNGLLRADTLVNANFVQTQFSNRNPFVQPMLQLSIGVSFQGSVSGTPQVRLMQFEIQQVGYKG